MCYDLSPRNYTEDMSFWGLGSLNTSLEQHRVFFAQNRHIVAERGTTAAVCFLVSVQVKFGRFFATSWRYGGDIWCPCRAERVYVYVLWELSEMSVAEIERRCSGPHPPPPSGNSILRPEGTIGLVADLTQVEPHPSRLLWMLFCVCVCVCVFIQKAKDLHFHDLIRCRSFSRSVCVCVCVLCLFVHVYITFSVFCLCVCVLSLEVLLCRKHLAVLLEFFPCQADLPSYTTQKQHNA